MNQFDPEALQSEIFQNIKPDQVTGTVDLTYPLTTKGGDQIELSAGWGQTGIVGRVGLKFTNFSVQNLFSGGAKRAGFIPQATDKPFRSRCKPMVPITKTTRSRSSNPG